MNALLSLWGRFPAKIHFALRSIRYSIIRKTSGSCLNVSAAGKQFRVAHSNLGEWRAARRFGNFEAEFLHAFIEAANNAAVIYDVGAFIGLYSLTAACRKQDVKLFSFEPEPRNCAAIRRSARANGFRQITVIQAAVGDRNEKIPFVFQHQAGGASGHFVAANDRTKSTIMLESVTLDYLVQSGSLPPPNVVKIDVEGYEARVLRGMTGLLTRYRPSVLVEVHPKLLAYYGDSVELVDKFLLGVGYRREILRAPGQGNSPFHKQVHVICRPMEKT